MLPIIISAPHACNKIQDQKIRERIALTDRQIWQMSDPLTGRLEFFTNAAKKHIARIHRILGDLNQSPDKFAFREEDFYGNQIFHENSQFTKSEQQKLLKENWFPYHAEIIKSVQELDQAGAEKILLVDFHSTAGDHPLGKNRDYMPEIDISNLSKGMLGKPWRHPHFATFPTKNLERFKNDLAESLGICVEANDVFFGGYELMWFSYLQGKLEIQAKLFALQIEYNLDLIVNPVTFDANEKALEKIYGGLDQALSRAYQGL